MKGPHNITAYQAGFKAPDTKSGHDPDGRGRDRVTHGKDYQTDSTVQSTEYGCAQERSPRLEDGFTTRMPVHRARRY